MKAKEYLNRLRYIDTVINQKKQEVEKLRLIAESTPGIDYSRERVQISPSGDAPFIPIVNRILELENEINADIDELIEEKYKIIKQIQSLPDIRHVRILYKKYVEFKSLEQIADELGYAYAYVRSLHTDALVNFEKIII